VGWEDVSSSEETRWPYRLGQCRGILAEWQAVGIGFAQRDGHSMRCYNGAAVKELEGHTDRVFAVVFSPDAKLLASASHDKTVIVWDTTPGAIAKRLKDHMDVVNVSHSRRTES